jgi:O-antigen ligase
MFIFVAPAMPMPSISTFGFVSPALVSILGIIIIYNFLTRRPVMVANSYILAILVCYLTLWISDLFCLFLFETKSQLPYLIARTATLILFITAISYEPSLAMIERMIRIYCWSIAALSILVILEGFGLVSLGAETNQGRVIFGIRLPFKKAVGFPMSDGEFGIMVAPAFFYFLLQFCGEPRYRPMNFRAIGLVLTFAALVIAQSRSTWLGLVLALTAVIALIPGRGIDRWIILMGGVALAALVGSQVYDEIITGFVGEGVMAKNVFTRFEVFGIAVEAAREAPIFGIGHGNRIALSPSDFEHSRLIHNHFIDALQAGGIIAALPAVGLYVIVACTMFKLARNPEADGTIRLLSIWMLGSMLLVVTELCLYRGFYSEHLPWLIGTSGMIVALHSGWERVVP